MDKAIEQFVNVNSIIYIIAIIATTFFVRRIVETAVPSVTKKADENGKGSTYESGFARWWNQVILYLIPVVVGGLIVQIPLLTEIGIQTFSGKFVYGMSLGWMSGLVYKVFRRAVANKFGVKIEENSPITPTYNGTPEKSEEEVEVVTVTETEKTEEK